MTLKKVCIVASKRTPFVKSFAQFKHLSNQDMLTSCLKELSKELHLKDKKIGEVVLGAVIKHPSDWNMARECVLGSDISPETPAFDLQKACGTSLEAVSIIANKIALGQIECGIAGGSDSNSDAPIGFTRGLSRTIVDFSQSRSVGGRLSSLKGLISKNVGLNIPSVLEPRTKLSMGDHTELMVKEWKISRQEQDQLALESHQKAERAYKEGFYENLLFPLQGVTRDPIVRGNTTLEKLAKLKPAFDRSSKGTLTAGNSTPLTDGAAVVFLANEEYARKNNLPILAQIKDVQSAAVNYVAGEGLLMAPTVAVSELLKRQNLKLPELDLYEIHEAFAGQVLCTLKAWEDPDYCQQKLQRENAMGAIERTKMNIKGGSLAIGHPFGATGARITGASGKMMQQTGAKNLLISVCTAGGMGVAALLETV